MKKILLVVLLIGLTWLVVQPKAAQAPWSVFPSVDKPASVLKFAVMSDMHSDLPNLIKALKQAKTVGVEFVVLTGDLTNIGSTKELEAVKKVLDDSGLPYYAVPGNHDYWQSRNINQPLFQQTFGSNYQTAPIGSDRVKLVQSYKLILVDNGDDYNGLGEEQWGWLRKELASCRQIRCLIFLHEPLNHPTSEHIMGESRVNIASEAAELRQELVDAGVKDLFAGHLHSSHHYTLDGLTTWIIGAVASDRNWQTPRFLEVTVGKTLEEREIEIE